MMRSRACLLVVTAVTALGISNADAQLPGRGPGVPIYTCDNPPPGQFVPSAGNYRPFFEQCKTLGGTVGRDPIPECQYYCQVPAKGSQPAQKIRP
jgi:hypothetical protein